MDSKNIVDHFGDLPDPQQDNRRHLLLDIIVIVICASICGAEKWDDIEAFGRAKEAWLRRFLTLPHGIPSHDTIARVFSRLDPEALNERFVAWVSSINPKYEREEVNIDGKTLRRSHDGANGKSAIHMVSAWANRAGLTLAQVKVAEKSNEITAIPELLKMLELSGCVVTIDAIGTQPDIAEQIVDGEADYVLALKGNKSLHHEQVKLFFDQIETDRETPALCDYHKTVNKDHGRIEIRECWATDKLDWLEGRERFNGLSSICVVKSQRTIGEQTGTRYLYYISSLPADAEQLAHLVRAHWGIANSLHWILDLAFREDECRKRKDNSAENFAILRHITLNLLKQEKTCKRSIAGKRLLAGWDTSYMEKVLFSGYMRLP
jgi:predicted transposase YbfD/YdcC